MLPIEERFARIGMIARWRPPHRGHAAVLRALCERGEEALIGIGSSNRYNARNPFTLDETTDMLRLLLDGYSNSRLIPVPDLDDGPRWRKMALDIFGALDLFVTDNPYVAHLLGDDYRILRPVELLPLNERIAVDGTGVRAAMARGEGWQALVPEKIAAYISSTRGLDVRFRQEFGLETLALQTVTQ
ncbi:MAG: hypothetical protein ACOYYJ_07205 [Chloroflexota bacterium]